MTPNEKSLIRAHYFQSVLRVAKPADPGLALRMIKSLETDLTTDDVTDDVVQAERAAIEAVRRLSHSLQTREITVTAAWNNASHAVTQWINLLI